MLRVRRALTVAAVALTLLVPTLTSPAVAAEPAVSGRAVDAAGRPQAGLLVQLLALAPGARHAGEVARTSTDREGRFSLPTADVPGGYVLRLCQRDGTACRAAARASLLKAYVGPAGTTFGLLQQPDGFPADGTARDVGDVTLRPPGTIAGTAPLVRKVRLFDSAPERADVTARPLATAAVARGRYRLTGLAPGLYRVAAGWSTRTVRVRAGAVTAVGHARRVSAITGTVRVDGAPARRRPLRVSRVGASDQDLRTVLTELDGRFAITRLAPGTYDVTYGRSAGRVHDDPQVTRRVRIARDTSRVRLDVRARSHGTGVAGSVDVARRTGWSPLVNLVLHRGETSLGQVRLDKAGRYRLSGLAAGTYRLTSGRRMTTDYERLRTDSTVVRVRPGHVTRVRRLVPREGTASLTVTASAGTTLWMTDASGLRLESAFVLPGTDRAVFRRVAPGSYRIEATSEDRVAAVTTVRMGTASRTVPARLGPVGTRVHARPVTAGRAAAPWWNDLAQGLRCVEQRRCLARPDRFAPGDFGPSLSALPAGTWDFQPRDWWRDELTPYHPVVLDRVVGRPGTTTEQDLRVVIRGA